MLLCEKRARSKATHQCAAVAVKPTPILRFSDLIFGFRLAVPLCISCTKAGPPENAYLKRHLSVFDFPIPSIFLGAPVFAEAIHSCIFRHGHDGGGVCGQLIVKLDVIGP